MNANEIPQADLLDILFEGRNKTYGAYDLRKFYNQRLTRAIIITLSLCLMLIFGYVLAGKLEKTPAFRGQLLGPIVSIDPLPAAEKHIAPPPPAIHRTPPPQRAMINASVPHIVPNDQVDPNEKPHTIEEMDHAVLGTANRIGVPEDGTGPAVPPNGNGTGLLTAPVQNDNSGDLGSFTPIERQASYIGGPKAWMRFLMKNCNTPHEAIEKSIQGTVIVQFVVDETGNVSEVQAISGPEELKGEAVRVIKKSGRWDPALQNGRHVKSYKKQPLVFTLVGDE